MGIVATTLSFSADTSLISSTSQTDPSRVLLIRATSSSLENSIMFYPLNNSKLLHIVIYYKTRISKVSPLTTPSTKPDTMLTIKLFQVPEQRILTLKEVPYVR